MITKAFPEGEDAQRGVFTVEVQPGTDRAAMLKNIGMIPAVHRVELR